MAYRITVRSLKGDLLVFKPVKGYSIEGGIITFVNPVGGAVKRFSTSAVEIEEELKEDAS